MDPLPSLLLIRTLCDVASHLQQNDQEPASSNIDRYFSSQGKSIEKLQGVDLDEVLVFVRLLIADNNLLNELHTTVRENVHAYRRCFRGALSTDEQARCGVSAARNICALLNQIKDRNGSSLPTQFLDNMWKRFSNP